jgi:hypothetical protein
MAGPAGRVTTLPARWLARRVATVAPVVQAAQSVTAEPVVLAVRVQAAV